MAKRYLGVFLAYLFAQLSPIPVAMILRSMEVNLTTYNNIVMGWQITAFILALIISIILLRKVEDFPRNSDRASPLMTVIWSILGFFMALTGQMIANMFQIVILGIEEQSQNTAEILELTRAFPIFVILVAIVGPILEELIFRKIIFAELYKRTNFIIAGSISGIMFAVVHDDFTHLLIYFVMSFVFAYVYVQSKRIIVPITAHVLMNTFVVVTQLFLPEELIEQANVIQLILIGG